MQENILSPWDHGRISGDALLPTQVVISDYCLLYVYVAFKQFIIFTVSPPHNQMEKDQNNYQMQKLYFNDLLFSFQM